MAKRFRFDRLSREDQVAVNTFLNQNVSTATNPNAHDEIAKAIEKTGTIPNELLKKYNVDPGKLSSELGPILAKIPSRKDALKGFVSNKVDVPNLTSGELQDRLDAFTQLGEIPGEVSLARDRQVANMSAQIDGAFTSQGMAVPKDLLKKISEYSIDALRAGNYNPQQVANFIGAEMGPGRGDMAGSFGGKEEGNYLRVAKSVGQDIPKVYTAQVQGGEYEQDQTGAPEDFSSDIKVIQDILKDRKFREDAGAEVTSFFNTAPGELADERSKFFDSLRGDVKDYVGGEFAQAAPESLARRGLQDSGQVQASIVDKYGELFSLISEEEATQIVADAQFFRQQQYDQVFAKLVDAGAGVSSTIASERGNLRNKQIQDFSRVQSDIESRFNTDLFKEQAKDAYNTYNKQLTDRKKTADDAAEAQLISDVANTGTSVTIASLL